LAFPNWFYYIVNLRPSVRSVLKEFCIIEEEVPNVHIRLHEGNANDLRERERERERTVRGLKHCSLFVSLYSAAKTANPVNFATL